MRAWAIGLVAACWLTLAAPVSATYSIVASDTATRQVGGAGTSCLRGSDVYIIYGSVPGVGAVHAQATYNEDGRDRAVELLAAGVTPANILAEIVDAEFDRNAAVRQYAVVDVTGRVAGFTGSEDRAYAADRQGALGSFHYSTQGNILTSANVLARAAAAFEGPGCDLAERLLLALEAGAEDDEGDSRCTPSRGIPSDSAFLQVDRPDEGRGEYLELHVPTSGNANPLISLREQFDTWREAHPCPGAGGAPAGGSGGLETGGIGGLSGAAAAAGTPGGGRLGTGGTIGGAGEVGGGAGQTANPSGAGGSSAGLGGVAAAGNGGSSQSGSAGSAQTPRDETGCSCRLGTASDAGSVWVIGLALLALGARGRRPARPRH